MKVASLLFLVEASAAISLQSSPSLKRVDILFSRHGLSCSNLFPEAAQIKDPLLTDCGVVRSKRTGRMLDDLGLQPDAVFTSELMRTMETAHYQYPKVKSITLPHILGSAGKGEDDKAYAYEEQRPRLVERHGKGGLPTDRRWIKKFPVDNTTAFGNWSALTHFLAEHFLPGFSRKRHLTLAVVTHNSFLKVSKNKKGGEPAEKTLCRQELYGPKQNQTLRLNSTSSLSLRQLLDEGSAVSENNVQSFDNNGVLFVSYDYNPKTKELTLSEERGCQFKVLESAVTGFCAADVGQVCRAEAAATNFTGIDRTPDDIKAMLAQYQDTDPAGCCTDLLPSEMSSKRKKK